MLLADLLACFALVEETSRPDYETSSGGWKPAAKKREMRAPELRYILVKDPSGSIKGFTSLMPTYEQGQPVIYCYEIHLQEDLRGCVSLPFRRSSSMTSLTEDAGLASLRN